MLTREMKDSGVEWIGTVPKNWELTRLGKVAKIQTGNTPSEKERKVFSDIEGTDWIKTDNLLGTNGISKSKLKIINDVLEFARLTNNKAVLVCCIGDIGKLGFTNKNVTYNQQINSVEFNEKMYWKFGMYFLYSQKEQHEYFANGNVLKILNTENQKKILLTYPKNIIDQKKVVEVLDEMTIKIDKIISDTKISVGELKKYKQALITETVTKGLNSNDVMKNSGIEWLGNIPKGWQISKIGRLFKIKKTIANQLGFDILSVTQKGLKVKDVTQNQGQMAANYEKYQIVEKNDFVMNHMDLLTGWVDSSDQEGVTSPDYRVFRSKDTTIVLNDYYRYIFQICYMNKIFYSLGQGVSNLGRWRLQTDKFLNFYLPVPPIEEQIEITNFLNSKIVDINLMIEEKDKLLNELEQYKKSLIYEYVTGKKEV
ncbi:restriction endonuclease subunit S [Enterococcus ureasiticus]|uniref:restriction endonuclease subunit S n=1 Tax=Enterococcus ureasiticus TaxID=903984 RepID=UPI001A90900D|nr:restriction endonuclease subunit S [Enterococcus ureasiticus]MBO0472856.1 restriction endonuclease subunit S [Enterococcus ureasiticus]